MVPQAKGSGDMLLGGKLILAASTLASPIQFTSKATGKTLGIIVLN